MPYTHSQQIGEAGETVFQKLLPDNWQARKLSPEYRVDFQVEVFDGEESTGIKFSCQVKSSQNVGRAKDGSPFYRLETEHLRYFVDECREPVFLVLIDLHEEEGYWLFVQGYAKQALRAKKKKNWRKQETVTVRIPPENQVTRAAAFQSAIHRAVSFMEDAYPGSPEAAIAAEQQRLEALDPRFAIDMAFGAGRMKCSLSAREDVHIGVTLKGEPEALSSKLKDLVDRGKRVHFGRGEISFTGSPLFEKILRESDGELQIQLATTYNGYVAVRALDQEDTETAEIAPIPVAITAGKRSLQIAGGLPESPLVINTQLDFADVALGTNRSLAFPFRMGFDPTRWRGQRVTLLAYFDQLASFYKAIAASSRWAFDITVRGNVLLSSVPSPWGASCDNVIEVIEVLEKTRFIARASGVDPPLPTLTVAHVDEIDWLYSMLKHGDVTSQACRSRLDFSLNRKAADRMLRISAANANMPLPFTMRQHESTPWPFLDQEVDVGPLEIALDRAILENERELRQHLDLSQSEEPVEVAVIAGEDAKVSFRRLAAPPLPTED